MIFQVVVKPAARENKVTRLAVDVYQVATTKPARAGQANAAVIELLATELGVKKNQVFITGGAKSKIKTVEVIGN